MSYEDLLGDQHSAVLRRVPAPYSLFLLHGPDAADFLHRLCTQDVLGIAVGGCRPCAFLNGKGKLVATAWAGRSEHGIWLEVMEDGAAALAENLERYHFSERVEIVRQQGVAGELVGVAGTFDVEPGSFATLGDGVVRFAWQRHGLVGVRCHGPTHDAVESALGHVDAPAFDPGHAEVLRICSGLVRVGTDSDATTLGLEADIDDHVSMTKGCYTGQEIVARIHTYGHVNRKLTTLVIESAQVVDVGTALAEPEDGEPVGRVMSTAVLPDGARRIALGYLPKDFWPAGTELRLRDRDGPRVYVVDLGPEPASAQ